MEKKKERAMRNELFVEHCLKQIKQAKDSEESIQNLLRYLGESLQCDRVYVFEDMDRQHIRNTYEWCGKGIPSGIQQLPYLAKKDLFSWYGKLANGENIIEKDISVLQSSDPLIYEILAQQHIHSIVLSPLIEQGEVVGLLGADNPPAESMEQISVVFSVLAYFVYAFVNQRELKKLKDRLDIQAMERVRIIKSMKKTVLLLDDSTALLKLNERVLRPQGYQILKANSIEEAKVLLAKQDVDVIIMDIDLPDGNGIDYCKELQGRIPVIFLTAKSDELLAKEGLHAGGCAFLTKPYQIEDLQIAVAKAAA